MSKVTNLTGDDWAYYIGSDRQFTHHIKNLALTTSVDITGWSLSWMLKRAASDADVDALVTKTSGVGISISGTFNASPTVNTQRATVTIEDSDTLTMYPGMYHFELKRMDAGYETPLVTGLLEVRQGVIR